MIEITEDQWHTLHAALKMTVAIHFKREGYRIWQSDCGLWVSESTFRGTTRYKLGQQQEFGKHIASLHNP